MKSACLILTYCSWGFCVAFSGCGDNELAEINFIRSDPASGSRVPAGLTIVHLIFDGAPRSVTVDGVSARVENSVAIWENSSGLNEGNITLDVKWLNQDGSEGKGVVVHYQADFVIFDKPMIVESTVHPGDKDVDPDQVNRSGITFRFNEDVRPATIEIRPEGGMPLNWIAEWGGDFVTITPPEEGKLLSGKEYVIEISGVTSNVTGVKEEILETLNFTLQFATKE